MSETKEINKEEVLKALDFNSLFRVKELEGVYTLGSKVNKSGMIKVAEFLNGSNNKIVHAKRLQSLGSKVFFTNDNKKLTMNDVFVNIANFTKDNEIVNVPLEVMVPDYDHDLFKTYEAEKILSWYESITDRLFHAVV